MLRKYATTEILSAQIAPQGGAAGLRRMAHRHSFQYEPRPGYLYVRSRAISSRTNDNFDTFPAEEIKTAYKSFVGKPVFVNHNNDNHRRARGVIIDAALHEDKNSDGSPDTWAEVLMEVDAVRFPKLAKAIVAGDIDRTSMGTDVKFSKCSFCGNKASTPLEYCQHIPKLKGKRIHRTTASGKKEAVLVSEICYGLGFFENSLLVEEPADPTAFFLGVDDHSKTATRKTASEWEGLEPPTAEEMAKVQQNEHARRASVPCHCGGDHSWADHSQFAEKAHAAGTHDAWGRPLMQPYDGHGAWSCNNYQCAEHPQNMYDTQESHEPTRGRARNIDLPRIPGGMPGWMQHELHPDKEMHREIGRVFHEQGMTEDARFLLDQQHQGPSKYSRRVVADGGGPMGGGGDEAGASGNMAQPCATCGKEIYYLDNGSGWLHDIDGSAGVPHKAVPVVDPFAQPDPMQQPMDPMAMQQQPMAPQQQGPSPGQFMASNTYGLQVEARGPDYPNPADHPSYQALGLHPDNIIEHWNSSTDDEKAAGMRWYSDAHHVAKAIAGGDVHKGAGVLSAYSPQTNWPANMFHAARSFAQNKPVGPGEGLNVMHMHANAAQRIMNGDHHQEVLGAPKTADFAHLIEHSGKNPETGGMSQKVVMDRHAISVVAGRRLHTDEEKGHAAKVLSTRHYYEHAAEMYRTAAKHISDHVGYEVAPHQVQAVTWLARQRRNDTEIMANPKTRGRQVSRQKGERNIRDRFNDHMRQYLPGHVSPDAPFNMHFNAAQVYLAYGETMAPADVDTLRDEECPVCGEADAYDGNECQVCAFVAPPKMFQDPDLDVAKQNDLRGDAMDAQMADPNGDGMPDVIPGSGAPGPDQMPMDPSQVADPSDVAQQQVNDIVDGQQPLVPEQLDANGQPIAPEEQGMQEPQEQDPNAAPMEPEDIAGADPGTPGDGVADLVCPSCGYQAPASPPQSTDMSDPAPTAGPGASGEPCPNCGQDVLTSLNEMNGQMAAQTGQQMPAQRV